jgi:glucokinase
MTIGIDIGGTTIKIGAVQDGRLISTLRLPSNAEEGLAAKLPELEEAINNLLHRTGTKEEAPRAIGVAFPSIVDSQRMRVVVRYVKFTDAGELDLVAWANKKWGVPLVMENDARAALVGEWQFGAGKGYGNIVLCTLGTGFGSAAMINGQLLKGAHFIAGNLGGHSIINFQGDACNCGGIGCVETEASSWVLDQKYESHALLSSSSLATLNTIDYKSVFDHADAGDALALEIRDHSMDAWSAAVINLAHAFDPEVIIVGGAIMQRKSFILPILQDRVDRYTWPAPGTYRIVSAEQGEHAGILGMAYLAGRAADH